MPHYDLPDYVDNTAHKMSHTLNAIIQQMEYRELDIATGFFEPQVWGLVGEAFTLLEKCRLLLGKDPEIEAQGPSELDLRAYYRQKLQADVEKLPYNQQYVALVNELIAFLERESVQVRLFPTFLHAKAYLFPKASLIGSSNFTPSGLTRKAELNLVNKTNSVAKEMRENWFEPFWQEAEEFKAQLIAELQNSQFGTAPYTPHQVFIKALYEYFKDRLLPPDVQEYGSVSLASFQQEGLQEALRLLEKHNGVMLADAVGLGKTYIGMGLLEHLLMGQRRRGHIPKGLVVCPAQLRELVWKPKLDEYGIKAEICSMEEMGRKEFDWQKYNGFDLILVDESHNFRNPNTGRYQNLNKVICTGRADKKVVLMTATPINNTVWDLYHQLTLITRSSDSYYQEMGIRNLTSFFKRVNDRAAELFDLLEESMVRRSRYDVKKRLEAGEPMVLPGGGIIQFPERVLQAIEYNLEQTYRGFYAEIAAQIENLNLVSYNIESFKSQVSDKNAISSAPEHERIVQKNNALIGLMKMLFLKRLESSLTAFETSINCQLQFQTRFFALFEQGRLLDSANNRKLLVLEEDEFASESDQAATAVADLLDSLPEVEANEYDLVAIRQHLEADIAILREIKSWIEIIRAPSGDKPLDAKLAEVKKVLAGPLKGQKVLIFTYYQDTARYLYENLQGDAAWLTAVDHPRMDVISGATANREEIVRRFAPMANTPKGRDGEPERKKLQAQEIQILISTDVLSEGQNLQDAGLLINYDLHWNPVRMIQRAGRIDRLGTAFPQLTIYNCFPEEGLESLLGLVERLRQRIADIDRTVGLDASVLGELIHPRSLEELKRIKSADKTILDDLEQQSELISTDEMKLPLITYLQSIGESELRKIPMGIHSGRRWGTAGVFFAFRVKDRHFWRFYPANNSSLSMVTDKKRIFQMLHCSPQEPRRMPEGYDVFPLLEQAMAELLQELKVQQKTASLPPKMTGLNKTFYEALNQLGLLQAVTEELLARVSRVLARVSLRPFSRDVALKQIQGRYKTDKDAKVLAEWLDAYFVEHELYREVIEPTVLEHIHQEDIQLVCYEVFTE